MQFSSIFYQPLKLNFRFQETSFASNQPVTRSLSSVTSNNKSKLPLPTSNGNSNSNVSNQNRINNARKASDLDNVRKASDLERISPWLVSSDAISTKKEKEKSKIPQLKTVITTELWFNFLTRFIFIWAAYHLPNVSREKKKQKKKYRILNSYGIFQQTKPIVLIEKKNG